MEVKYIDNTVAYFGMELITAVNGFIAQAPVNSGLTRNQSLQKIWRKQTNKNYSCNLDFNVTNYCGY